MIIVYYPCYNCIGWKHKYMCGYVDNNMSLVSFYRTSSLIKDGHGFLVIDMSCHLITGSHHYENDVMDKTQTINIAYDRVKFIAIVFCMSSICSLLGNVAWKTKKNLCTRKIYPWRCIATRGEECVYIPS